MALWWSFNAPDKISLALALAPSTSKTIGLSICSRLDWAFISSTWPFLATIFTIVPLSKNAFATKIAFANKPPVFPLKSISNPFASLVLSKADKNSVVVEEPIKLDICIYPISFFIDDLTDSIFMDFLVTIFVIFCLFRINSSVTWVFSFPLTKAATSAIFIPLTFLPLTLLIMSFAFIPAVFAGVPSNTLYTTIFPASFIMFTPIPEIFDSIELFCSAYSFLFKYLE